MTLLDDLDPIFADCVGVAGQHRSLRQPWVQDGFVYASDGRIVVRQPTTLDNTMYDTPNAQGIFDKAIVTDEAFPVPDIGPEQDEFFACPHCDGSVPRTPKVVVFRLGLLVADRYVWLLHRHKIVEVRTEGARDVPAVCFHKGDIQGILLGMMLGPQNPGQPNDRR